MFDDRITGTLQTNTLKPNILATNSYYPYGMLIKSLSQNSEVYRWGFQGHEQDNEIKGIGNHLRFGDYGYDTRLGRRWNLDPVDQIGISNYAVFGDNPVNFIDPNGTSFTRYETEDGQHITTTNDGNPNTVVVPNDKLQAFEWGITHTTSEEASQPEWNLIWQQYMGAVDKRTDLQVWTLSMVHSEASREAYLNYWRTGKGRMKAMFTEIGAQWKDPEALVMSVAGAVAGLSGMRAPAGVKVAAKTGTTAFRSFTSRNFRHNLGKMTGNIPANSQAHHVFPQKYVLDFEKAGIKINDPKYGVWWNSKDHLKNASSYNAEWGDFFLKNKNATQSQILNKGRELMQKQGIDVNF